MARTRDEKRRMAILSGAKKLFARQGFSGTSISDIVRETGFPVGSIYTYFASKEEIVRVIIEEGWTGFRAGLLETVGREPDPEKQLALLIDRILPQLVEDVDLISIILSEAVSYADLESKLEELTTLLVSIIHRANRNPGAFDAYSRRGMKSGIIIFFIGILNTVRLSRSADLGITAEDALRFVKDTIRTTMGVSLDS